MKLDLRVINEKVMPITLLDGTTINVKKPSRLFINEIEAFKQQDHRGIKFEDIEAKTEEMTLKILNNNTDGRIFDGIYLNKEGIDYIIQTQIFKAYFEFIFELMTNPN